MIRKAANQIVDRRFCCLITFFSVLVLLTPLTPLSLPGQTSPEPLISNTIGLGPQIGYWKCSDVHDGTQYLGVLSRIRISNIMALEGAVGYTGNQLFNLTPPDPISGPDITASVHSTSATASLILYAPLAPHFLPYVLRDWVHIMRCSITRTI